MTPEIKNRLKLIFNTVARALDAADPQGKEPRSYRSNVDGKVYTPLDLAREVQEETDMGIRAMNGVWEIAQKLDVPVSAVVYQMFKKS